MTEEELILENLYKRLRMNGVMLEQHSKEILHILDNQKRLENKLDIVIKMLSRKK